jgi:hypothetical protein
MIGFAEIAATAPSDVSGMTKHLLNNTLGKNARLAAYYSHGRDPESEWFELAEQVISGEIEWGVAVDLLMERWDATWDHGDNDDLYAARTAYGDRLDEVIAHIESGLAHAPLAVVRPDTEAGVLLGLGIRPGMLLNESEINNLLAGRRADGEFVDGKHYAVERALPVDKRTGQRKWSTPIGSYDFCATPDKSVSVVWAFSSDVDRARIFNAHLEANREAVGYIADEIAVARFGKGGQGGRESGSVGILEFTHHTSRRVQIVTGSGKTADVEDAGMAGDMNLHTHNLIPNAVFCPSGKVGTLDTLGIHGLLKEAGAFYQARLGTKLRDAGFDAILDEKTGSVRLSVISDEVRDLYSKKTRDGEREARKAAADAGLDWAAMSAAERVDRVKEATQRFETKMKGSKGAKDDVADFDGWRQQAKDAGWAIPDSFQLIGPPLRELTKAERHRAAYEIALPWLAEQLEHEAVLTHFTLRRAALRGLVHTGMSDLADVDAVTKIMRDEGVLQYGTKTALKWGQELDKRYISVTTSLHEDDEVEFVRLMKAAAFDKSGAIQPGLLRQKIETSGLDFSDTHGKSQREAIERVGTGGRFGLVLAAAGAGKTTALKPLVASWTEMGKDVYGASLAWRQADDLVDAGIGKRNVFAMSVLLDRLGFGLPDGEGPPPLTLSQNSVVAIDEWGLLGTRQGLELLKWREKMGFSIVALGDEKQCQAIEAGAIIDLSKRALGVEHVPIISTTKRQVGRESEIAGLLRDGRAAEALAMKREDGTADLAYGGREGVIKRVSEIYVERLQATGVAPSICAPTNSDAHQISAAVRSERRRLGMVGERDLITIVASDGNREYNLPLAKGDRVRLFKSTGAAYENGKGGSIGRNGSVLEVMDASQSAIVLKTKDGRVGTVEWGGLRPKGGGRIQLAYGDCMTIHSAQGSTSEEHIFALPSGSKTITGHTGYSAATRHKSKAYLVTSEVAERISVRESRPINDTHDVTIDDKWAMVAKALSYQPERDSALSMLERAQRIRTGAVNAFHQILTPPDPRLRTRSASPRVPEIVQERKLMDAVLEKISLGLRQVREAYRPERSQGRSR